MESTSILKASLEYLRSAQMRLICRVDPDPDGELGSKITPYISDIELGWDEVLDEGYDPHHSPLGCPVYWRVVKRGDEQLYCSTFLATDAPQTKSIPLLTEPRFIAERNLSCENNRVLLLASIQSIGNLSGLFRFGSKRRNCAAGGILTLLGTETPGSPTSNHAAFVAAADGPWS